MDKELPFVYVNSPSSEEVEEMIKRMQENGAKIYDTVDTLDEDGYCYDDYSGWGYRPTFGTYTRNQVNWLSYGATPVSMEEFRKLFPLKGELPESNVQGKPVSNGEKQQDAILEALKELTAAYRNLGGLDCAYDKELLVAEAIIKKVGDKK